MTSTERGKEDIVTEEERDERRQVEEGRQEDLELDEPEAGDVRGGDTSLQYAKIEWTYTKQKGDGAEPKTLK